MKKANESKEPDNRFGECVSIRAFELRLSRDQIESFFALVQTGDWSKCDGDVDDLWEFGFFTGQDETTEAVLTPAGSALYDLLTAARMNPNET